MTMARVILFISLSLLVTAYAFSRGGGAERGLATILWAGFLATWLVISPMALRYHNAEVAVAIVDGVCLIAMMALAIRADRFWTLWVAAMQVVVVLSHLAMWLRPVTIPHYYKNTVQLWIYPQILLLAIGTLRHRLRTDPSPIETWLGAVAGRVPLPAGLAARLTRRGERAAPIGGGTAQPRD